MLLDCRRCSTFVRAFADVDRSMSDGLQISQQRIESKPWLNEPINATANYEASSTPLHEG
jgi:hypothetical protein